MGVQGFIPKSPESVVHSLAPLAQRPVLQSLQSADTSLVSVQHGAARRGVALALGGGLSLSAFTVTWLGRRSRRQPRPLQRRATAQSVAAPRKHRSCLQTSKAREGHPCLTCLERRKRRALDVHFLYASPILRPGSSAERLPPLSWQEEAAAVQDALGLDAAESADMDAGSALENDTSPSSASTCSVSRARMHVSVATVEGLSRLAASHASPGPTWWHIATHSEPGTGRLILEDEDGAPQAVSMAAQLFACQTPPLGVSILACAGEQAGRALLSAGASFVVASSGELRDVTARIFASHFYRRLQCACASQLSEPLERTDGFASQVRLAFGAAREALQTATNRAVRIEAKKLLLLEKGAEEASSGAPRRSLAECWMPVAMGSDILPGSHAGVALAKDDVEDEASISTEDNAGESTEDSASSLSTCSKQTFPQDCEDFVGRGPELQRLMQILGASGGRRLLILHGPNGAGKSALGAELCRFATSPGRKFAAVRGNRRLAFVSLQDPGRGTDADAAAACARLAIFAAAAGLASSKSFEGRLVRTCLVVDDAEERLGWRDDFVPELLDKYPQLCLLVLRRSPLYRLDGDGGERWKPVNIALGPLPEMEAAQLFLQRLHRPIFPADLSRDTEKAGEPLRPNEGLLRRMMALPALAACKGFPRKVVRLAAEVTWELPSLLHLQPEI